MASACLSSPRARSWPQRISWCVVPTTRAITIRPIVRTSAARFYWGLEFLIAGDIIRTVVVAPTIQNVVVLGLIVFIRTFLSLSLQLEIEGKLPWRREGTAADPD